MSISTAGQPATPDNAEASDKVERTFTDLHTRLLSKREIAQYFGKSERSVDRLRKRRVIPYLIIGGSIRFRLTDVEKALSRFQIREVAL
jgi:excisionase family DNA binding protein